MECQLQILIERHKLTSDAVVSGTRKSSGSGSFAKYREIIGIILTSVSQTTHRHIRDGPVKETLGDGMFADYKLHQRVTMSVPGPEGPQPAGAGGQGVGGAGEAARGGH